MLGFELLKSTSVSNCDEILEYYFRFQLRHTDHFVQEHLKHQCSFSKMFIVVAPELPLFRQRWDG